jgi:hypothetical protein
MKKINYFLEQKWFIKMINIFYHSYSPKKWIAKWYEDKIKICKNTYMFFSRGNELLGSHQYQRIKWVVRIKLVSSLTGFTFHQFLKIVQNENNFYRPSC